MALWPMDKFHAQIWQFWKLVCISETAAPRLKISSISTPGVERQYMWNFGKWPSWFSSRSSRPMGLLFLFFKILHFWLNMWPYVRKNFKRHLLWKYITDSLKKKKSCIFLGRVCIKLYKNCEILNFLAIFSSAWLCEQSSWNRNEIAICPLSVCPYRNYLWT